MHRLHVSAALALLASACVARVSPMEEADPQNGGVNDAGERPDQQPGEPVEAPEEEPEAEPVDDARPFTCAASKSPMFDGRSELALRISGDFTRLNSAEDEEASMSEARIEFADGSSTSATIKMRGNSRKACGYRPFFVKFAEKQQGNVFEKLGKSVKLVTHCGDREGMPPILKAGSLAEYEERLRLEHAIYEVLDQLGIPSLKTRLVQLTYHDTATDREERHLAMVREPEDETAERCGMVERDDDTEPSPVPLTVSPYGELLTNLVNEFVIQYDRKNVFPLEDRSAGLSYSAAYDFDLVGVIREDYGPNDGRTLADNLARFADWLRVNQSQALTDELTRILARAEAMRAVSGRIGLSAESQARVTAWLDGFLGAMAAVHACAGESEDAARTACFVADDFGDDLENATPIAEGETAVRLEPVADVDAFSATLAAGTLYTFQGCATSPCLPLTLLDAQGTPLREGTTLSFRPTLSGSYFVRTGLQGPLLAISDGALHFYRDDAGETLDTATQLVAGSPLAGRWELQSVIDDDWLRFEVSGGETLHVVAELTFGLARLSRVESLADEESVELLAGDNDLSPLIAAPGAYVLKLLHTDQSGYEVRLEP